MSEMPKKCSCDDPEFDATDFAHPAWWRGCDYSVEKIIKILNEILDKLERKENCSANFGSQSLNQLVERLSLNFFQKKQIKTPNIQNVDSELEMIKDLFDIEFALTVKGNEIKGYNNGKIYLDSTNCIELAEAFLKISNFLEMSNPNYDLQKGWEIDRERLFPTNE